MPRFLASNTVDSSSLSTSVSLSIRLVLRNLPEIKFHFHYKKSVFALRRTNNITRCNRTKSLPIKNNISSFAQAQKPQPMAKRHSCQIKGIGKFDWRLKKRFHIRPFYRKFVVTGEAAALPYDCCAETFLEEASLSMNSQKTVHARAVIQPEPEFSCSGFGLFQSLLHSFRWTRVTEALGMTMKRLWMPTVP